jgi:hypothetical protein
MSWDIFVQDLPRDAKTVADIPDDFKPAVIGTRSVVISKIKEVVPTANFSDPSWGLIDGNDWSIELNMGRAEECDGFVFHVRGGEDAAGVVAAILQHLDLRALDSQTDEFFVVGPETIASFNKWRAYRDSIVEDGD